MLKRVAAAVSLLLLLSFVAGCGGGGSGGGGGGGVGVTPSTTTLQFTGLSGEAVASQNINVTLTDAPGSVFVAVDSADPSVASASFNITGDTTGTITVTPYAFQPAGTYRTTVFLRVYRNKNGTDLLATFSYGVTLTLQAGLSVNPGSLTLNALEGGSTQGTLAVTLAPGITGPIFVEFAAGQSAPWLRVSSPNNNSTIQLDASANTLPAGVYQVDLNVILGRPNGALSVRVPVTFTVGVGLVAPSPQTLVLNRDAALGSVTATVNVVRADGQSSAWTASTSQSWLVASSAGTTPGTLTVSLNPFFVTSLPEFADSTATVTIAAQGLAPVTFTVTLQKRLPYVAFAGPHGMTAGAPARIVVGGRGFNQLGNDPLAALQAPFLNVSAVDVLSDTQLALTVTAPTGVVPFTIGVANAAGMATPIAKVRFSDPVTYTPATVPDVGAKNIYLHDPVRHAVFALSRSAGKLVRYQFDTNSNGWITTSMVVGSPLNMAMAPDGSHIWITDLGNRVVEIDPDLMQQVNIYVAPNFAILQNAGGVLPVSSDGRLWLPGSSHYFDLRTRTFGALNPNVPLNLEFGYYHGSLDGSLVLISPSLQVQPFPLWGAYEPVNEQITNPMGSTNLWYEPRLSLDGTRTLEEFSGKLYNRSFTLLGQLPAAPGTDSYSLMTLTPDGEKILVLRKTYTNVSQTTLASQAIDIYSTTTFAPSTTDFVKIGSIPISVDASICNSNSDDCFYGNQYLLPTQDSKTVFWIGNQNMQVFSIP